MRIRHSLLFFFLLSFHFNVFSVDGAGNDKCNGAFTASKLDYANQAVYEHRNDHRFHPQFTSVAAERVLVPHWDILPSGVPNRIKPVFPEDVHLISHQLLRPANATTVKLGEPGNTVLIARAHYTYDNHNFSTNVTFSARALANNLQNIKNPGSKNWLVGENATAGILYLHGGGTRSTGGHTAEGLINHYKYFNIDVLSLDLPWHGAGHREVLSNPEAEIKALAVFVQKYVPPNVPLFVWGHSWGATWAEMLLGMVNRPHDKLFFHHNLKGVMIMSPPVDTAPGKDMQSKLTEYQRLMEDSRKNKKHLYAPKEANISTQMVHQGKINPLSSVFTMLWILYLDHRIPEWLKKNSKQKKDETLEDKSEDDLIPGIVVEGMDDPLTGVNFIKFFRKYYAKLKNITLHLLKDVGHLLGDYKYPGTDIAVDIKTGSDFIAERLGLKKLEHRKDVQHSSLIPIVQEYANKLDFRIYVAKHSYFVARSTSVYGEIEKAKTQIIKNVQEALENYHSPGVRIKHVLEQLVSAKDQQEYQEIMVEIQTVVSQPDFSHRLSNTVLVQSLSRLNDHIVRQRKGDGSFHYNVENLQSFRQLADEILTDPQFTNFFQQHTTTGKKTPSLVTKIVNSPDLETAKELVKAEKLPRQVEIIILDDLIRLFEMKKILNNVYAPTFESIAWRSSFDLKDRGKIESRINSIRNNVEKRIVLQREIEKYRLQLKNLQVEYKELLTVVAHNVRLIKEAFDKSAIEIPDSLKGDLAKIAEQLNVLEKTSDKLNEVIEQVLASKLKDSESMNINVFSEIIDKHAELISEFVRQYNDYATNYRRLRKKLIVAIEEGEMGEKSQEAVVIVYGRGSGGNEPLTGNEESRYLKLKRKIEDMAQLESKLYKLKTSLNELNIEYQELFIGLLQVIQLRDQEDLLGKIPRMHIYYSNTIKQLLSGAGTSDRLNTQEQREEFADYVRKNDREFQQIYKNWKKDMESDLPPLLPTHRSVEF